MLCKRIYVKYFRPLFCSNQNIYQGLKANEALQKDQIIKHLLTGSKISLKNKFKNKYRSCEKCYPSTQ